MLMLLVILRQLWIRARKDSPCNMGPNVETDNAEHFSLLIWKGKQMESGLWHVFADPEIEGAQV